MIVVEKSREYDSCDSCAKSATSSISIGFAAYSSGIISCQRIKFCNECRAELIKKLAK